MKTALVLGAGGFIGSHMVKRLKAEGYHVTGVDLKLPEFSKTKADCFKIGDLRDVQFMASLFDDNRAFDEVLQFAALMGGAGFIFTGDNDADIMASSARININLLTCCTGKEKIFYSSSACVYPQELQTTTDVSLRESDAYPANPDSAYGWEKLFSEQLYEAFARNGGYNIRIARFHNIFGPEGTWKGGKEKAPAAICRKVAEAVDSIQIWGDGTQTRSFLYIDECIEGVRRLMASDYRQPVNIGSDEMVSINYLVKVVCDIANKKLTTTNVDGPIGVHGRNSNNELIERVLGWKPSARLREGLVKTYHWINEQL